MIKTFNTLLTSCIGRLFASLLFSVCILGCNKSEETTITNSGGISIDDVQQEELKSAFKGGGTVEPTEGDWSIFYIFSDYYPEYPSRIKEKISIEGFYYTGKEYTDDKDAVERISLYDIPSIGNLIIPMNQGKYEGGNELVSSLTINEFFEGRIDFYGENSIEDARVSISIVLKDNCRIDIRYVGSALWDGMF